ncbi:hypothetical protein [Halobaculum limi]|uniref:hypothetical protein n=1 Tax=Halobaculum limi TaxID=3031916 RepID=UPI002405EC83|nr:hypothetical protein [Halobaculum sp. YSMS11]
MSDASPDRITVGDLRIEADIEASVDGDSLRVRSRDGRMEVYADCFAAIRALSDLPEVLPSRLGDALDSVPVGVHLYGVEIARIDPGVSPGPLSRALGTAPARVHLRALARALTRRPD